MNIANHYLTLINFALKGERGYYAARSYMAEVTIFELEKFVNLKNKRVLDVGGEFGDFCKMLKEKRNCEAVNVEPKKLPQGQKFVHKTVIASADKLPFRKNSFDVVLLRGVIQHIPTEKKKKVFDEMFRVLKKGGFAYLMIPPWYNPLSGQNIKPFQYFPYKIARHLRNSIFNSNIRGNSLAELGLWPMTINSTLNYVKKSGFKVLAITDIIGRMHFLSKIPLLREVILSSVGFVLKKQ